MTPFFAAYTFLWITACLAALVMVWRDPGKFAFTGAQYYRFLCKPWKLAVFALGFSFVTFIAPYSGDCTWDYVDGSVMSVLTFLTAPWAVGIFYDVRRRPGSVSFPLVFVACCVWMFSLSWFYDLYVFLRYHYYPPTWASNIVLSSMLYGSGGLLWNLDWSRERGVFFSFTSAEDSRFVVSSGRVFPHLLRKAWIYIAVVLALCGGVIYGLHQGG
jgi:hypothetical protein